jgi:hypothetical protein
MMHDVESWKTVRCLNTLPLACSTKDARSTPAPLARWPVCVCVCVDRVGFLALGSIEGGRSDTSRGQLHSCG